MKIYKSVNILAILIMFMFTVSAFAASGGRPPSGDTTNIGTQQNASATVEDVSATAGNNLTIEASKRSYAIQGNVQYGAMPGYFGDNNKPGHQFIPLDKLLMYTTAWNITGEVAYKTGKSFNFTPYAEPVAKEDRSEIVICTKKKFNTDDFEVIQLGVGACNTTSKNQLSSDVFEYIKYKAACMGATHIQFLAEGTNTELQSAGWGIGLNYTKATDSSVATGGTGYSTGHAGYQNLPWLQFFFLKVVDPNAVAEVVPEIEKADVVASDVIVDENVDKAVKAEIAQ